MEIHRIKEKKVYLLAADDGTANDTSYYDESPVEQQSSAQAAQSSSGRTESVGGENLEQSTGGTENATQTNGDVAYKYQIGKFANGRDGVDSESGNATTLSEISRRTGVSVEEIARQNGLENDPDTILEGQEITVTFNIEVVETIIEKIKSFGNIIESTEEEFNEVFGPLANRDEGNPLYTEVFAEEISNIQKQFNEQLKSLRYDARKYRRWLERAKSGVQESMQASSSEITE